MNRSAWKRFPLYVDERRNWAVFDTGDCLLCLFPIVRLPILWSVLASISSQPYFSVVLLLHSLNLVMTD